MSKERALFEKKKKRDQALEVARLEQEKEEMEETKKAEKRLQSAERVLAKVKGKPKEAVEEVKFDDNLNPLNIADLI